MKRVHCWLVGLCVLALAQTALVAVNFAQERQPRGESEEFHYEDPDVRNPFIPLFVPTPTPTPSPTPTPKPSAGDRQQARVQPTPVSLPDLRLDGVFWSPKRPLAIVNHQLLHIGEWIAGARVVQIDRDTVYLNYQGYPLKLELSEDYAISIE